MENSSSALAMKCEARVYARPRGKVYLRTFALRLFNSLLTEWGPYETRSPTGLIFLNSLSALYALFTQESVICKRILAAARPSLWRRPEVTP